MAGFFSRKEKRNIRLSIKKQKRECREEGRAAGRGAGEARVAVVWQGWNNSTLRVSTSQSCVSLYSYYYPINCWELMLCFREYFYLAEKLRNNFSEISLKQKLNFSSA